MIEKQSAGRLILGLAVLTICTAALRSVAEPPAAKAPASDVAMPPEISLQRSAILWQCKEELRWGKILDWLVVCGQFSNSAKMPKELQDEAFWLLTHPVYIETVLMREQVNQTPEAAEQAMRDARKELEEMRRRRMVFTQRFLRDVQGLQADGQLVPLFEPPALPK